MMRHTPAAERHAPGLGFLKSDYVPDRHPRPRAFLKRHRDPQARRCVNDLTPIITLLGALELGTLLSGAV